MQSNVDCIMDDIYEFPDSWAELYNSGPESIMLSDFAIGTSDKLWESCNLPFIKITPGSHVIIYCDKQDKPSGFHTNFRLESGKGCKLFLFSIRSGEIVDQLPDNMVKQPSPNISFGRKNDGSEEWGYQEIPTPNAKNCGTVLTNDKVLGNPLFSSQGKVFANGSSFQLELSIPQETPNGTVIRYTLDGTEPNSKSKVYDLPLTISETTIIRAKLFCSGYISPRSTAQSFIKLPRKQTLPVVSIITDNNYLYGSHGLFSDATYSDGKKYYQHNWRRPINIEYFETYNSTSSINQLCEMRVAGGKSREFPLKTMCIYANKRFGEKRLDYEFFPDQRPYISDYKSILLRNAGNDFEYLYMRDAIIQSVMSSYCDIDWQAYRPAIVYINGQYKGILNIRERSNEDNIYSNYSKLEDIDMIENAEQCKVGTFDNWNSFVSFYSQSGHSYEEYAEKMDIKSYIDVMIMNFFFCNLDFPGNNSVWWRPRDSKGKWRMLVKDTDYGLGLYDISPNYDVLKWFHKWDYDENHSWANTPEATILFRNLEKNQDFLNEFIDRFIVYMGDFLNYQGVCKIWEPMYDLIQSEYPYHAKLYGLSESAYTRELQKAKNWLEKRVDNMYSIIRSYYKMGNPCSLKINNSMTISEQEQMLIYLNGIKLSSSSFNGQFFSNRRIQLEGENVVGWKISVVKNNSEKSEVLVSGDTFIFTMPNCQSVTVTSLYGTTALDNISNCEVIEGNDSEVFDLSGRISKTAIDGLQIFRSKDGSVRKIWK